MKPRKRLPSFFDHLPPSRLREVMIDQKRNDARQPTLSAPGSRRRASAKLKQAETSQSLKKAIFDGRIDE